MIANKLSLTVSQLRKSGELTKAWDIACPAIQENTDDKYLKGAFFWLCYEFLKQISVRIKEKNEDQEKVTSICDKDLEEIDFYVDWIERVDYPPDEYSYRSILLIYQNYLEFIPRLALLLYRRFDYLFQPEDKKPWRSVNSESPCLMVKFTRILARLWIENVEVKETITIDDVVNIINTTQAEVRDRQNLLWLEFDKAKCLILAGRCLEARKHAMSILKKKQSKSWAWRLIGNTYEKENPKVAIMIHSKALCVCRNDNFAIPLLKDLTRLLSQNELKLEASMCVKRLLEITPNSNRSVQEDIENFMSQDWFNPEVDSDSLDTFVEQQSQLALQYLAGETTVKVGIVQSLHNSKKGFLVYLNRDHSEHVRVGLFKMKELPNIGDYIQLTISKSENLIVHSEPAEIEENSDVAVQEGILKVLKAGFGFIDQTFVPSHLIRPDYNGRLVRVISIYSYEDKKKKYGWKAIKVLKNDEDTDN